MGALQQLAAVVSLAYGARGVSQDALHTLVHAEQLEPGERRHRAGDGCVVQMVVEAVAAETDHLLEPVDDLKAAVGEKVGNQQVKRVGAEIERGDALPRRRCCDGSCRG